MAAVVTSFTADVEAAVRISNPEQRRERLTATSAGRADDVTELIGHRTGKLGIQELRFQISDLRLLSLNSEI